MSTTAMEALFAASYSSASSVKHEPKWGPVYDPDLWLYRDRTVGLLRRYGRLSVEVGRLPSILGRDFFRAKVTSYHVATFEDVVIFVHDVERSLEKLDEFERDLIATIVLEEYSQEEAARLLGCTARTVRRRLPEALDRLSDIFLSGELLTRIPRSSDSCQEGASDEHCVSNCMYSE
jgi:DNA-directed RNA polymerase specialized sigma24 family protein